MLGVILQYMKRVGGLNALINRDCLCARMRENQRSINPSTVSNPLHRHACEEDGKLYFVCLKVNVMILVLC